MSKHYTLINNEKRITATSKDFHVGDEEFIFDFPEDFDFSKQDDYKIINGECVYDPCIIEPVIEEPTQLDKIEAQIAYIAMMTDISLEV